MGDDADVDALRVEERTLLDMQLEVGVELAPADRRRAGVADALELVAEALAVVVTPIEHPIDRVHARERARGDHGRREARAFLVRPVHDFDGSLRGNPPVVKGAQDFQSGKHSDDPVIAAAVHLGVEMAADHHGEKGSVRSLAAGEDASHPIDAHRAARLATPGDELVAHLAVGIRQRHAGEAAGPPDADLRRALDRAPVSPGIYS